MTQSAKKKFSRLPKNIVPSNYDITIIPDMEKFVFRGTQRVDLSVVMATDMIEMNSKDIAFGEVSLSTSGGVIKPTEVVVDKETERVLIKLPQKLIEGSSATLHLQFDGVINDTMNGFYRTKYTCPAGVVRPIAVTQFEATSARKAFPCWDEPAIKATFDITLLVPQDMTALCNMPVKKEVIMAGDGKKCFTFEKTAKMSTYLVAYAVGHFECVQGSTPNGVKVAVYTPLGRKHEGEFALQVGLKTLPFYDDFFGTPYPLPKCDMIAIPEFAAGAMENWGLVTYRETALLVDPKTSSPSGFQRVALVVGHELAHQWFGNLVTMEWWTDLWLNEGFATWVEYLCVDHCFPEYDIWTQFLNDDYSRAQNLDALCNTHPIEVPVGHPDEIDEIFDAISYSKGACVIRMLNSYMSAEKFKQGLRYYLNQFKYGNAVTIDLWKSLEHTSGMSISEMMSSWTKQSGFPVIDVSMKSSSSKCVLLLKQKMFRADGSTPENSGTLWHIPITVVTSNDPSKPAVNALMTTAEMELEVPCKAAVSGDRSFWIKLNHEQTAFYRVCYSDDLMKPLIKLLSSQTSPFSAIERHGLQSDLFWMAKTGKVSSSYFLQLFLSASHEKNYTVWSDRLGNISAIKLVLQYSTYAHEDSALLNKMIIQAVLPTYRELGSPKGHLEQMLQSMLFATLGRAGEPEITEKARSLFRDYMQDQKNGIPLHLRGAVFSVVMHHAKMEDLELMLRHYEGCQGPEEKIQALRSIGFSSNPEIIQKVLEYAISNKVLNQDRIFPLTSVSGGSGAAGREISWKFFQDNWPTIDKFYPSGGYLLCSIIGGITCNFASEQKAQEVEHFFKKFPVPAADRTIKQSVENIRLTASWVQRDQEEIHSWLCHNVK